MNGWNGPNVPSIIEDQQSQKVREGKIERKRITEHERYPVKEL